MKIPVACTLDQDAARQRAGRWGALADQVLGWERSPDRVVLRLTAASKEEVRSLVEAERECCGFVGWDLEEAGDDLVLTITGDAFGVEAMVAAFSVWSLAPGSPA